MLKIGLFSIISFLIGAIIVYFILNRKIKAQRSENALLSGENICLKAELKAKDEIKQNADNLSDLVKKEFTSYANELLLEKQKSLQEQNKTSLESFLNPLKEKIKDFQAKVEENSEIGKLNTATLKEKIEDLMKQSQLTCSQTEKLSNAISQNSKSRGLLGEMILDKLLKSSGLIDKKDNPKGNYETQIGFKSTDGTSGTKIVDAIIYLTENRSVIVDSKASLAEFINFSNAEDEEEKQSYLKAFLHDITDRIKELSNKYSNLEGVITPDFTIMFIPFEYPMTYIYANNKLIEDALKQNVIIAGPSTLIATLRTINYSWAQKNQYDNMQEIINLSKGIYEKCTVLIQKFEGVQTSFETVRKKFDDVFATAKGRGGLIGQVEKLKDYGVCPSKTIDEKYLDTEPVLTVSAD